MEREKEEKEEEKEEAMEEEGLSPYIYFKGTHSSDFTSFH
jgi:hypothetical protein